MDRYSFKNRYCFKHQNNNCFFELISNFTKCIIVVAILFFFHSCASIVSPSGGPRDVAKPEIINCEPPNYSTNFTEKNIKIIFNEFVELKNLNQELIISPLLEAKPEVSIRGKSAHIKLLNPIEDSVTYAFSFGESIADITEGNILNNYTYYFSTKNYIDSLSVRGNVLNAFTHKPLDNIFVLLFNNHSDSAFLSDKPYYITKADEKGNFIFHNLKLDKFRLFAIQDINNNNIYDLPGELIAFHDSIITPTIKPQKTEQDSTILKAPEEVVKFPFYNLYVFEEKDSILKIIKNVVPENFKIITTFNRSADSLEINILNIENQDKLFIKKTNPQKDSLTIWIANTELDSITFEVRNNTIVIDTVITSLKASKNKSNNRKNQRAKEEKKDLLKHSINLRNNKQLDYFSNLILSFPTPLSHFDSSRIYLIAIKDSITLDTIQPNIILEKYGAQKIILQCNWTEGSDYKLFIPDSVIYDIYQITNDSIDLSFTTSTSDEYIDLHINLITELENNLIIQLLNNKNKCIKSKKINKASEISFQDLRPGQYNLKLIVDKNNNGIWDTGNYKSQTPPESIYIYNSTVEIKKNFSQILDWIIK